MTGGQIVGLVYLSDILPDLDPGTDDLEAVIVDDRLDPTVRMLQSLGEVFVGMCSCYEFVVL